MDEKQIAKAADDSIKAADKRFHPRVWAFMNPEIAADIRVAFAIEHAIGMVITHSPNASPADIKVITAAIRAVVYAGSDR